MTTTGTTATGTGGYGAKDLLRTLQERLEPMKYHYRQMRGSIVGTSPLTILGAGQEMPAMGIRGLTYEPGDLVICLVDDYSGIPIALPLTRTP
jgi:hypothetical protein